MFNFIKNIFKINNTAITCNTSKKWYQRVERVLDYQSLGNHEHCGGFLHWNAESTKNPAVIGKIFDHLRTAYSIKLYITNAYIEYSAMTKKHGFVCGGCHRMGPYSFFEFGLARSGHRWDIYGEDRSDPTIKAFYEWWENLVKPYEKEFDNDFNL